MFNKISSINKNMVSSGRKDAAFNPGEEALLTSLKTALEASKPVPQGALDLVIRMVTQWDYSDRLPGLDLLRSMAKYPNVASYSDPQNGTLVDLAIHSSLPQNAKPNENAAMMGVRTIANLFASADGRSTINSKASVVIAFLESLLGVKGEAIGKANRNLLIAISTTAVNLSVLVHKEKLLAPEVRRRLVIVIGQILKDQTDSEVIYRALVALGTVLSGSKAEAVDLGVQSWIKTAAGKANEPRVQGVAAECRSVAPSS